MHVKLLSTVVPLAFPLLSSATAIPGSAVSSLHTREISDGKGNDIQGFNKGPWIKTQQLKDIIDNLDVSSLINVTPFADSVAIIDHGVDPRIYVRFKVEVHKLQTKPVTEYDMKSYLKECADWQAQIVNGCNDHDCSLTQGATLWGGGKNNDPTHVFSVGVICENHTDHCD